MTVPVGAVLLPLTDGGAVIVDSEGVVVAVVAPAWAVDANGQAVPTHYRIDGTTLVQVIDHHGAAYPVVGDPYWSRIVNAAVAVAAGACAVACTVAGVVAGVSAPGCGSLATRSRAGAGM